MGLYRHSYFHLTGGTKCAAGVRRWAQKVARRKSFGKRAMRVIWHEITQWAARNFESHPKSSQLFWFASAKPVSLAASAGSETPRCSLRRLVLLLSIMKQLKLLSLCAAHTRAARRRRRDQTNTQKNTAPPPSPPPRRVDDRQRLRYLGRSGYDAGQCGALLAGGPLVRDSLEAGPVWQTVVLRARAAACGQRKLRISKVIPTRKNKVGFCADMTWIPN